MKDITNPMNIALAGPLEAFRAQVAKSAGDLRLKFVSLSESEPTKLSAIVLDACISDGDLATIRQCLASNLRLLCAVTGNGSGWVDRQRFAFSDRTLFFTESSKILGRLLPMLEKVATPLRLFFFSSGSSSVPRAAVEPGDYFQTDDPVRFWERIAQGLPDIIIVDLSTACSLELAVSVRQDLKTARLPLLVVDPHGKGQPAFSDGLIDLDTEPETLSSFLHSRHLRHFRLRSLIETDELTGLANRRRAWAQVDSLLRLAKRQGVPVALSLIDIDRFKSVNDTYGHQVGDRVLRRFGRLLKVSFREHDIAARFGGEEFLVATYAADADKLAHRLLQTLRTLESREFRSDDSQPAFRVSFSAGVVELGPSLPDFEQLCRAADELLYKAKETGRRRIVTRSGVWVPDTPKDS